MNIPKKEKGLKLYSTGSYLRFEIDYIADETNFVSMMKGTGQYQQMPSMTMDELVQLQFFTDMVAIPDEVYETLSKIRKELRDEGIRPSDQTI